MRVLKYLLFLSLTLSLAGCQSYAPKPLDLEAHSMQWRDRRADDGAVLAYVQSLREAGVVGEPIADDFDLTSGIDLRVAEWIALLYNPELRLTRADHGVAQAIAEYAGLWDDPSISVDVLHILSSAANPWIIGSAVSVTLPLSGRLESEQLLAAAQRDAALLRVVEHEQQVIRQLREHWLEWSALHHRMALIDDLLADLESITASAMQLAELGEMLRTEAALFEIEQTSRRIERAVLLEQLRAVEEELRMVMGLSPAAPLHPKPHIAFAVDGSTSVFDDLGVLERFNPRLAHRRAAYAAAEERLHLEVRKQYPDLAFGPQYESESGQSRIGFIGSIPLPILNANRQGIAEADAAREKARAEYETAYERIVGRAAVLQRHIAAARLETQQIATNLAPLIDRQVSDARQLLELGEGSALALLEGIVRRHEAKLRALGAVQAESTAAIELLQLRGESMTQTHISDTHRQEAQP